MHRGSSATAGCNAIHAVAMRLVQEHQYRLQFLRACQIRHPKQLALLTFLAVVNATLVYIIATNHTQVKFARLAGDTFLAAEMDANGNNRTREQQLLHEKALSSNFTSVQNFSLNAIVSSPQTLSDSTTVRSPTVEELNTFARVLNDDDLRIYGELLDVFNRTMEQAGIPYFMYGGTLIGSWRHHGPIPWDDDVDVSVSHARRTDVEQVLRQLEPRFHLKTRPGHSAKFYHQDSKRVTGYSWGWPFIDVFYYMENSTHVYEPDPYFPDYNFIKDLVFPLLTRPYLGRMLPAPRDTKKFLTQTYKLETCMVGGYNHRTEKGRPQADIGKPVNCNILHSVYPFVHRVSVGSLGCNETLVDRGAAVSWYFAANVTC